MNQATASLSIPETYASYRELVSEGDVVATLAHQLVKVKLLFASISEEKANYRYAPGKWTIKEVLGHMIDTERVMAYRALCFSRGEEQALNGFDQNAYTTNGRFTGRTLVSLLREYALTREANLALFGSFDQDMLYRVGTANGKQIAVQDILYKIAGHELHHLQVLRERYLETPHAAPARRRLR